MSNDPAPPAGASQAEIDEAEWEKHENWKLGMFYASERDSRLWVPKRTIFRRKHLLGSTPNLAKRAGRIYIGVLSSVLLAIVLVLMVLKRMSEA